MVERKVTITFGVSVAAVSIHVVFIVIEADMRLVLTLTEFTAAVTKAHALRSTDPDSSEPALGSVVTVPISYS